MLTYYHAYEKKYLKMARIFESKFQQLVRLFSADLDAS